MTNEELAVELAKTEQRARSNTRRIDKLEQSTDALTRLATSVEVMATKQDSMADTLDRLDGKVETLEGKPAKRWESLVEKALLVLAGAFAAWLVSGTPGI